MASATALLKSGVKGMDLGKGLIGWGVNGFVGAGVGYALGRTYSQFKGQPGYKGWLSEHAPTLTAAVGKLGAVGIQLLTGGPSIASGLVDAAGQAGVTMLGCEYGLRHGRATAGYKVLKAPATVDMAKLPAGVTEVTSIGALGQAAPGRGLSWDQINELAAMR